MRRAWWIVLCLLALAVAGAKTAAPLLADGGQIAFSRAQDRRQDVTLLDVRTRILHNLTRTPDTSEIAPAWSTDGQRLSYITDEQDSARVIDFSRAGLPVTDLDPDELAAFYPRWIAGSVLPPISLAYQPLQYFARERMELRAYGGDVSFQSAYAPDRRHIAYIGVDELFRPGVLRTADLATDAITTLTPHGYVFQYPAWSPDGHSLVAQYDHDAVSDLVVLDVGCLPRCVDAMRVLVHDVGDASSPDWSADGTRIVYSCRVDRATSALCVYDLAADQASRLTSPAPGISDREPSWRPIGDDALVIFDGHRPRKHPATVDRDEALP
ncbi:MAG: PD40 domain-containing protein [Anaerolineae bacterium]|nr:PD40 domain-containing protein [Anaerolineae bacterium]